MGDKWGYLLSRTGCTSLMITGDMEKNIVASRFSATQG